MTQELTFKAMCTNLRFTHYLKEDAYSMDAFREVYPKITAQSLKRQKI